MVVSTSRFCPEIAWLEERCTLCMTCARVCPTSAISMRSDGAGLEFDRTSCIGCGHCSAFCPADAFGTGLPLAGPGAGVSSDDLIGLLSGRRSMRIWSGRDLSIERIEELLRVVGLSPTGVNARGVHVRICNGTDRVRELFEPVRRCVRALSMIGLAGVIGRATGFAGAVRRISAGEDMVFRGAPAVLFFHYDRGRSRTGRQDAVIAASLVMVHAETMGLGTRWNGVAERLYPLFRSWRRGAGRGMVLAAVLCVGEPGLLHRPLRPGSYGTGLVRSRPVRRGDGLRTGGGRSPARGAGT